MITYSEKYGELWKMFIFDTFFLPHQIDTKKVCLSKKRLVKLNEEFENFLFNYDNDLGIAG